MQGILGKDPAWTDAWHHRRHLGGGSFGIDACYPPVRRLRRVYDAGHPDLPRPSGAGDDGRSFCPRSALSLAATKSGVARR